MDLRYGVAVLRNIVLHYVKIGAMVALAFSLSGCFKVKCDDGSYAKDENGVEVTIGVDGTGNPDPAERMAVEQKYCPRDQQLEEPNLRVEIQLPPQPVPTNMAPIFGGVAVASAAFGLGGGGGGGGETPSVQPTPPTQTPGRPATSTR